MVPSDELSGVHLNEIKSSQTSQIRGGSGTRLQSDIINPDPDLTTNLLIVSGSRGGKWVGFEYFRVGSTCGAHALNPTLFQNGSGYQNLHLWRLGWVDQCHPLLKKKNGSKEATCPTSEKTMIINQSKIQLRC